jgi:flagellar M-ring protein FliF
MNQQAALGTSLLARFPALARIKALPKPILLGIAAALVALIVVAVLWSRGPDYKVLFSNLDDRDGGAIVTALGQMNVPYKFNSNGTALLVPADRVYDTRMQLASQGLPHGGSVGLEILDKTPFGASQFTEQVNYQRGLEGELARTIEAINSVQSARVHLALPRQSLFVRDRQPATASVLLKLYPGRSLSQAQVSAIAYLVASSVPDLNADHVSIIDQNGHLLSNSPDEGRGMDANQLHYTREIEQHTVERILTILNPLVGPGNVRAQVSADIDFSRREQTAETYRPNQAPGQAAIRSQQTSDSRKNGPGAAEGVPGALSNQAPATAQAPIVTPAAQPGQPGTLNTTQNGTQNGTQTQQQSQPVNQQHDATTNYELDRTITHTKDQVGIVRRLSVAVVVNDLPGKDSKTPKALPPEELAKLTDLVKEAMGYDAARGDSVNVVNSAFNDAEATPPAWRDPQTIALAKTVIAWLIFAAVLLWLYRKIKPAAVDYFFPPVDEEAERSARLDAERAAMEAARDRETNRYQDNLTRARDMATKDPRAVAMVLRSWMASQDEQSPK